MNKRQKISLDAKLRPDKGYHKNVGADGWAFHAGEYAFSDDINRWIHGKSKQCAKARPLF